VWTDPLPSIAGAGCVLTRVGAGEEQVRKVVVGEASSVEKTSRLRSRNPMASGVKCGLHGSKNSKMKLVDGFLVEPQNQGRARTSWEPSHEW
jgi:hypothetical protein